MSAALAPFAGFEFGEPPITPQQIEAEVRQWRGLCRLSLYTLAHKAYRHAVGLWAHGADRPAWEKARQRARNAMAHANRLSQEARR